MDKEILIALISFFAGSFVALVGVFTKYLFDYRVERRKLHLEEREGVTTVLGSSQSSLVRATRDLYRRLSSFFDNPDSAREWLKPAETPDGDEYYLREFVRLLFNFIAWGRIAQDMINSLPTAVMQERPELQQAYVFVDLASDILAYSKLFSGIEAYHSRDQDLYLFIGHLDAIAEEGGWLWKEGEHSISRAAFDNQYRSPESPVTALREFFIRLHGDQSASASFIVARLAALRAVLAGFLTNYSWTIYIPDQRTLVKELQEHLQYASETSKIDIPFVELVPHNLGELMNLYQCKLFRLP